MILPRLALERVAFFENHGPVWAAAAGAIGLTAEEVAELAARTGAARAAYQAQRALMLQARAATLAYHAALTAMDESGTGALMRIKGKATAAGNEGTGEAVYVAAQIPAPARRSRTGTPGTPTRFAAALDPTGAVTVTWRCADPHPRRGRRQAPGTVYHVWRRVGEPGPFEQVASVGRRAFTDGTIPAGAAAVTYRVAAFRSAGGTGTPAEFTVKLGGGGGGGGAGGDAAMPVQVRVTAAARAA